MPTRLAKQVSVDTAFSVHIEGGRRDRGAVRGDMHTAHERAYNANHSYLHIIPRVRLSDLKKGASAVVSEVEEAHSADPIARRLRELGFVHGEPVRVVASPLGGDPLLVQIGFTRFALRRSEAARVHLLGEDAP